MTTTKTHTKLTIVFFAATTLSSAVIGAVAATEEPTVHVGDGTIDGSPIREYDNVWLVTVRYNDGRIDERGLSSDHVRFRTVNGRQYLSRSEGTTSVIGKPGMPPTSTFEMTFNVFEPQSLRPLLGESYGSAGDSQVRRFDRKHVTTRTRASATDAEKVEQADTAEPAFDAHGGMTGLLLAALPLKVGYTATLPGIGDTGLDVTAIRVVGEQEIQAGHLGKRKTWVVEIGPSPGSSIYWISKTAPYVIRATVKATNAVASWDML